MKINIGEYFNYYFNLPNFMNRSSAKLSIGDMQSGNICLKHSIKSTEIILALTGN